ncbi:hypothetical protein MLD38_001255 [Melastoma candidum]|nr:hypothetical protein MLD38_001255 [Melastoma candidum]
MLQFQQLVEVEESARIYVDILNGSKHDVNSIAGNLGLVVAGARVPGGAAMPPDNQPHQGAQSGGVIGTHATGNQGQESERSALRCNSSLNLVVSAARAFDAAKDIMETLRSKHTNSETGLLEENGSRFVTLSEERLLVVVNALIHHCHKYPTTTTAEVPKSLEKELSGVCIACFSTNVVSKYVNFVREYKQDFE